MNRYKSLALGALLLVLGACLPMQKARAQGDSALDPRIKALITMSLYGAVGGALLGTASLAFDTGGRAVAKGASLGLYAGIAFGTYVVVTHAVKRHRMENPGQDYYPETPGSPYEQGFGGGAPEEQEFGTYQLWAPAPVHDPTGPELQKPSLKWQKGPKTPLLYLNFVNFSF